MGIFLSIVMKYLVIIIGSFLVQCMQARQYNQGQVDWNRVVLLPSENNLIAF
jgi:hypothetical protein